jgi:ParB-like chromosome segregation protein Spo0J
VSIHDALEGLTVPLDELTPFPGNPRRGDVDAIAESLDRNFQYKPIVVNRKTGHILAGNHTYLAARKLGWSKIAAVMIDVTEAQARRIVAADNKTADLGHYDDRDLAELLAAIGEDEDGFEGTGYNDEDLTALMTKLDPSGLEDFAVVEPTAPAPAPAPAPMLPTEGAAEGTFTLPPPSAGHTASYAVLVLCDDEDEQQSVFEELDGNGYRASKITT